MLNLHYVRDGHLAAAVAGPAWVFNYAQSLASRKLVMSQLVIRLHQLATNQ